MTNTTNPTETTEAETTTTQTWITITQLQKRYDIGRTAAYAWAHRLPNDVCIRIGAKKLLINEPKLINHLEQKGTRHILRNPRSARR